MPESAALRKTLDAVTHLGDQAPPWSDVLWGASQLIGTDGAVLIVNRHGCIDMRQVGADPAAVQDYGEHFHTQDVLLAPGLTAPKGTWLDTQAILSPSGRQKSSYYNDFMCKHHMKQLGSILFARESSNMWASIGVQRSVPDERLGERVASAPFQRLLDALTSAIAWRQSRAEQWLLAAEALFDSMGEATLLMARSGAVAHMSPAAEARLSGPHGIVRNNRLWHASDTVRQTLARALLAASRGTATHVKLPAAGVFGSMVVDFVKADRRLQVVNDDLVFVRLRAPAPHSHAHAWMLKDALPITNAEAEVLAALIRGQVAKEIATQNGVSIHTVRKQIASLMGKLGCSRQLELVQKALAALGPG